MALSARPSTAALALFLIGLIALIIRRWRHIATPETRLLIAMAAAAPPIGLLLLGFTFDNAPIELRYLAFATPYIGLLLAAALPRRIRNAILVVQAIALLGLMTRPETMQPARATAIAAASLAGGGVVLLPRGNDGVGIVGAFAVEAPPTLRLLVIGPDVSVAEIRTRASGYPRVVLALLGQDAKSRATLPLMQQAFTDRCWVAVAEGYNVLAFDRLHQEEIGMFLAGLTLTVSPAMSDCRSNQGAALLGWLTASRGPRRKVGSTCMPRSGFRRLAVLLIAVLAPMAQTAGTYAAECLDLPRCVGCGCRGGPGYRAPDGHCVGYLELAKVCGPDPEKVCSFENRRNTGLNRDCILQSRNSSAPDKSRAEELRSDNTRRHVRRARWTDPRCGLQRKTRLQPTVI